MGLVAFGKNTLKNLIESNFFEFKRVIISEEKRKEYLDFILQLSEKKIKHEILSKNDFDRHVQDRKHQGIIAFIKKYDYVSLNYLIKKKANKNFPLLVMLDSIEDPHNFGAIIRTCAAMEVDGLIIADKKQVPVNNTVIKVSTGGISYVPICRVNNLEEAINNLKINCYSIISTVCDDGRALQYNKFSFNSPVCVIFGNEHEGIKKRIIKKSDLLISIPLENQMNSLNVSVSFGIVISSIRSRNN